MNLSLRKRGFGTLLACLLSLLLAAGAGAGLLTCANAASANAPSLAVVENAAEYALKAAEDVRNVTVYPVSRADLCRYPLGGSLGERSAYTVHCKTEKGTFKVLVDAVNGTVLDFCSTTFGEQAECFDTDGKSFTASYNERLGKYVLGNEDKNTYVFTLNGKNYYQGANGSYVVSDDRIFGNTKEELDLDYHKATQYYDTLLRIREYYSSAYGAAGDKYLIGMYNDSYDGGNNSFATDDIIWKGDLIPAGSIVGVISIGMNQDATCLDLIAHEYMHRVEQNKVGLIYRGESGALMEAYSDIFGELVEAGLQKTTPNWVHNGIRDLKHPDVHGYPVVYNGEYYAADSSSDNGSVHKNSTVISHAAYLMWNGIDGSAQKKLDSRTLGMLFMKSLDKFNVRETFPQCAKAVYETAQEMNLTKAQIDCVATAFEQAGLPVRDGDTTEGVLSSVLSGITLHDLG